MSAVLDVSERRYAAVSFDLDDTLVDHRSAAAAAVGAWAAEYGICDAGVAERWDAICEPHYARYQRQEISMQQQRRLRVREFLGRELSDAAADEAFAGYLSRYEAAWAAFPDAAPALARARAAGLVIAILTNGDEGQQRRKLRHAGLEGAVDRLIASSTLPAGKPDPRAFAVALERAGTAAGEALMVGDSLGNDVVPALRAEMGAVLVDRLGAHPGMTVDRIAGLDELRFGREEPARRG